VEARLGKFQCLGFDSSVCELKEVSERDILLSHILHIYGKEDVFCGKK